MKTGKQTESGKQSVAMLNKALNRVSFSKKWLANRISCPKMWM